MQYQTRQGQFKLELQNCSGKLKTGKLFTTRSLVEAHGLFYDLIIFGVLLSVYDALRGRRERITRYQDEIDNYRGWDEKEASYRIVGIIRRLNKDGISNINLSNCYLKGVNLSGLNLANSNCKGANLEGADLEGTDLTKA
ncbi:MAG: pentapeptide repeat-containing protein, partial [Lewinellaceae bacterium]|nr:pentapeptide repeat-containing protein [Lewinellaceae bacterium]